MALVHITIRRLHSLVFNELDLSPLLFLLRVVDAGQKHESESINCNGYARWPYGELCLPICCRHQVGNELCFEHTGQNWISFFRLWAVDNLQENRYVSHKRSNTVTYHPVVSKVRHSNTGNNRKIDLAIEGGDNPPILLVLDNNVYRTVRLQTILSVDSFISDG